MRILCLHGTGTNVAILRSQTVGFRSLLPKDWQWSYVDGEEDTEAAQGVKAIFPGPYLCYYVEPSLKNLEEALSLVDDVIDEEGPFDAIMGFSQGGAVAASMILRHQLEKPFDPPLFRFAIFMCSSLPFSWGDDYGFDVTSLMLAGQSAISDFSEWQRASMNEPALGEDTLNSLPPQMRERARLRIQAIMDNEEVLGKHRRFHAEATTERIKIPTVHVYGAKDEARDQSLALLNLCDSESSQVVKHEGGHELPRAASQDIAKAIQRAAVRADFMF